MLARLVRFPLLASPPAYPWPQLGEVVPVARGHARDDLIPKELAVYATEANISRCAALAPLMVCAALMGRRFGGREREGSALSSREVDQERLAAYIGRKELKFKRQRGNAFELDAAMLAGACRKQLNVDVGRRMGRLRARAAG